MISYTIKKIDGQEDDTVIKQGHSVEFKMSDIKSHLEKLAKVKKELEAQRDLDAAKMENIKGFHPEIAELSPEKLVAAEIYSNAYNVHEQCVDKLAEIEKQEADYATELEVIKEQTGLSI